MLGDRMEDVLTEGRAHGLRTWSGAWAGSSGCVVALVAEVATKV